MQQLQFAAQLFIFDFYRALGMNLKQLVEKRRMYVGVMAHSEMQTDLPESRAMSAWWDYRARGLGGRPVSCAEENVLCFEGDHWGGENIFVHEFAHIMQQPGNKSFMRQSLEAGMSGKPVGADSASDGMPPEFPHDFMNGWVFGLEIILKGNQRNNVGHFDVSQAYYRISYRYHLRKTLKK